jgi:excisionase family DNA binding protein
LMTITQAARQLGVPETTLRDRLAKHGITVWKLGNYSLVYSDDAMRAMQKPTKKPKGILEVYE